MGSTLSDKVGCLVKGIILLLLLGFIYFSVKPTRDLKSYARNGETEKLLKILREREKLREIGIDTSTKFPLFFILSDSNDAPELSIEDKLKFIDEYTSFADVSIVNEKGENALFYASEPEVFEKLLSKGLSAKSSDNVGNTPLHNAQKSSVISVLLEAGADINAKNSYGFSPLHEMVWVSILEDSIDSIKFLLERGADVNIRDEMGDTPLHKASLYATQEVVSLLIDNGADYKMTNNGGNTPLDELKDFMLSPEYEPEEDIIKIFEYLTKIDAKNENGKVKLK